MIVRRVGALSFAKVTGMLYALMGLIFGACISLFSFIGSAFAPKGMPGGMGMLFGAGAIIALPIFYGLLGFVNLADRRSLVQPCGVMGGRR
jgi:hypothetical protein